LIAQALIESQYGQSGLTQKANNMFGMKGSYNGQSITMLTGEYTASGQYYTINAQFRKYSTINDSMTDYANLLRFGLDFQTDNYKGTWRENSNTVEKAAMGLVNAKYPYATSPTYAQTLINTINTYNLKSFDKK
jgi:flagellum-specific peptidoglycan hydrolase FlgJ